MSVQRRALVLNQNYEPLNVCSVRRAFVLVFHGKAEVLENGEGAIFGATSTTPPRSSASATSSAARILARA